MDAGYVEGIGTQSNPVVRLADGAVAFSYSEKLERMYDQFTKKVLEWKRENPDADVRIAEIGFSRGAEEAAGFTRMIDERGVQDPSGLVVEHGKTRYTKPPLVPASEIARALVLVDPVGTGGPRLRDRRPTSSVLGGVQLVSRDEPRNLFQSTSIMDPGFSDNGRFLSITVAGVHSNLGDTYHHDGLGKLATGIVADAVNGPSDTPLVQKPAPPTDIHRYAIHRSQDTLPFYRTSVFDEHGERGRVEALAPRGTKGDGFNAEPRDEMLAARFEFRPVPIGAVPGGTPAGAPEMRHTRGIDMLSPRDAELHRQSRAAVQRLDASMGRTQDEASDRVSAALLPAAREAGLGRIDHVARSHDGRTLFAVEGELSSPNNRMALIDARMAVATPVDTSLRALDTLNTEMERRASEQAKAQHAPSQAAPVRAMPAH